MPFTPTHILAVLPVHFTAGRLLFPALAVGAMIPDFTMFYPLSSYHYSHSWIGLFGYCLPAGLLVYYLWEVYGKILAIDLSPLWIRHRINHYRHTKPGYDLFNIALIAIAIMLGSLTHVVWDAFTHAGEWGVEVIPLLNQTISISSFTLSGYKIFQYGSTLIGLPLLIVFFILNLNKTQADCNRQYDSFKSSWLFLIIGSLVTTTLLITIYHWYQADSFQGAVGNTIKQSIGAGIFLFFMYAILYKIRKQDSY